MRFTGARVFFAYFQVFFCGAAAAHIDPKNLQIKLRSRREECVVGYFPFQKLNCRDIRWLNREIATHTLDCYLMCLINFAI